MIPYWYHSGVWGAFVGISSCECPAAGLSLGGSPARADPSPWPGMLGEGAGRGEAVGWCWDVVLGASITG